MAAIKLDTYKCLNSDDISSAYITDSTNVLVIRMKNGEEHWVRDRGYYASESVWDLYRKIEAALA